MRRSALAVLVVWATLVTACGPGGDPTGGPAAPTPTPGGMGEVLPALALRGARIQQTVGNDPGCPGSALRSNAVRIELAVAGDENTHVIYLFRWRRPGQFDAASQAFADCVDQFSAGIEGEVPVETVEVPPWRAYGPGWSDEVRLLLEEALLDLAGG
jgi:hypothetical protein